MFIRQVSFSDGGILGAAEVKVEGIRDNLTSWSAADGRVQVLFESTDGVMPPLEVIAALRTAAAQMETRRAMILERCPQARGGIA